jgi:hypothetical protein
MIEAQRTGRKILGENLAVGRRVGDERTAEASNSFQSRAVSAFELKFCSGQYRLKLSNRGLYIFGAICFRVADNERFERLA